MNDWNDNSIEIEETDWGAFAHVFTRTGDHLYFASFDPWFAVNRASVLAELDFRMDGCPIVEIGVVPTGIAAEGRAVVAAYLFSAQENGIYEISKTLDINPRTVRQYIIDVKNGRR